LPDLEVRSPTDSTAELARVLAHVATLPVWCAPTPPEGMRPAALGGECARCLARPGYHEGSCVRRLARGLTEEQADDVRSIRRSLGLTQEALGGKIGYRSETISRWENGHEEVPPVVRLALIGLRASRGEVAPASAPVSTAQEKQ
jgi:DNA-binding XRE family transcriptional regulator